MEKSRLYSFIDTDKQLEVEDPVQCEGYLSSFKDLKITCILLDEIMKSPNEKLDSSMLTFEFETKPLRKIREFISEK